MIVKCVKTEVDEQLATDLGMGKVGRRKYCSVEVGEIYLVMGISYKPKTETFGNSPAIQIKDKSGALIFIPLALFEVVDSSVSKHWKVKWDSKGFLTMWPEPFYKRYFHDDLMEGVGEVRAVFKEVCRLLEEEANLN